MNQRIHHVAEESEDSARSGRSSVVIIAIAYENMLEESVIEYRWCAHLHRRRVERRNTLVHPLALLEGNLQVPVVTNENVAADIDVLDTRQLLKLEDLLRLLVRQHVFHHLMWPSFAIPRTFSLSFSLTESAVFLLPSISLCARVKV
jgi:hypothetical protein